MYYLFIYYVCFLRTYYFTAHVFKSQQVHVTEFLQFLGCEEVCYK